MRLYVQCTGSPVLVVATDLVRKCVATFSPATSPMARRQKRGQSKSPGYRFLRYMYACHPFSPFSHHHQLSLHRRERNNGGDRNSGGSVAPPCIARWRWTLSNFIICLPSSESDPAGTSRAAARCWSASTQNNVSGTSRPSAHCMYF